MYSLVHTFVVHNSTILYVHTHTCPPTYNPPTHIEEQLI